MAEYAQRDHEEQGEYYVRHLSAMTGERLHDKSAIAGELAHRDMRIAELEERLTKINRLTFDFAPQPVGSDNYNSIHDIRKLTDIHTLTERETAK